MDFEYVRHLYRALHRVGLVTEAEGTAIEGSEGMSTDESHGTHAYYVTTPTAEELLQKLDD